MSIKSQIELLKGKDVSVNVQAGGIEIALVDSSYTRGCQKITNIDTDCFTTESGEIYAISHVCCIKNN
jgi:hypothetical protein